VFFEELIREFIGYGDIVLLNNMKRIKYLLKKLFIKLLIWFGRNDSDSFVLAYHDISDSSKLTAKFFEYQIKYYLKYGYQFISQIEELNKPKKIFITFDDGYASFESSVLPILIKYKVPCILFVPTKYFGIKLEDGISKLETQGKLVISERSLKNISKNELITLGCHTHSHFNLFEKGESYINIDIKKSVSILENITNQKCEYFCYPQGKVNDKTINIIKNMGFKYGFTTENRSYQYYKDDFKIPRYAGDYFLNKDFLDLSRNSNCNLYMSIFNRN
jgi:peptidoglycan/xylan/chitin deacetylase (PgdA/CDA1 family)